MPQPARRADLPQLADVLTQAFHGYAWTQWTVPMERHQERVRELQQLYLEHVAHPHGMVWTVKDRSAAAAFIPADVPVPPVAGRIAELHGNRLPALTEADQLLEGHRPDHDWVLATVGVAPQSQGRGLGSAVVMAGLSYIDEQDGSCLVETSDPNNLPFYSGLGFETVDVVKTAGPFVWIMLRPAGPMRTSRA